MKKLLLAASLCVIALAVSAKNPPAPAAPQEPVINEQLIGRWELTKPEGSSPTELSKVRQKVYTRESYVVLEVDKANNTTYVDFIGKLTAEGPDRISEVPIYTLAAYKAMLGRDHKIVYKIVNNNRLYLAGINYDLDEVWIRISE